MPIPMSQSVDDEAVSTSAGGAARDCACVHIYASHYHKNALDKESSLRVA